MGRTQKIAAVLLLAGCQSNPAVPTVVQVPVSVPCVKSAPMKPLTMDESVILKMDDYEATIQV